MSIEEFSFGRVVVEGREFKNDILITPGDILNWRREKGHYLQEKDLKKIWDSYESIDVFIAGTGVNGKMKVETEVKKRCEKLKIELIKLDTGQAVKKFNLMSKERSAACGLHLTC